MRKKDIDNIIELQNLEEKQAFYEKLKSKLNLPDSQPKPSKKRLSMPWKISIAAMLVVVVCLAIVLPVVLRDNNSERYCAAADCQVTQLDCTLKGYAEQKKMPLLYVDWYDVAEEIQTFLYTAACDTNDMVFLREMLVNGETGDIIILYLSDRNTRVDILDYFDEYCKNEIKVQNVTVYCDSAEQKSLAFFEFQDYRYYIEIFEPDRVDLIQDIIEGMLS